MTDFSIPASLRWIPKSMTVEYLGKAETDLCAVAELGPVPKFTEGAELPISVNV